MILFAVLCQPQEVKCEGTTSSSSKALYLSDIPYVNNMSSALKGRRICLDQNDSNDIITLLVEGKPTKFIKGICAWANSTIVYDLRKYDYDYFTSYIGVDTGETSTYYNTGAKFAVYTSADGSKWIKANTPNNVYKSAVNADFIKVSIKGAKYLKLVARNNQ